MHDLMRDLCLKKAKEQRFVHVKNKQVGKVGNDCMYSLRRVSLHPSYRIRDVYASAEFMSLARSFLCTGLASGVVLSPVLFGMGLLRVLDIIGVQFSQFPAEILQIVNLRYLAFFCYCRELPSDISRLWNLRALVIRSSRDWITLPSEIWQMTELRLLKTYGAKIDDHSDSDLDSGFIQEKLETLSTICPLFYLLSRLPNIKNLGLSTSSGVIDIDYMLKLEVLKVSSMYEPRPILTLRLPPSMRKLSLTRFTIPSEVIKHLCELPNLEILKLHECEFEGQEWDATEEEFSNLRFLLLERLQLVRWRVEETTFPRLLQLVIRGCSALEEIPSGVGEIPTLQTIELDKYCSPSVVASAELIIEEQRENGNNELQLRV